MEPTTPEPQKASVSDKKKFFEKAMEEQHQPSPKPERVFTFLSQDEVEKLKQEEEKKIASLSRSDMTPWAESPQDEYTDEFPTSSPIHENPDDSNKRTTVSKPPVDGGSVVTMSGVRTAKAERRMKERLIQEGLLTEDNEKDLSPADLRALKAEKRAAWRQARLKSLEQDALQAQMVIKKMSEMIDSKTIPAEDDPDASVLNNNQAGPDHENNVVEVETTREKIISLELSTPSSPTPLLPTTLETPEDSPCASEEFASPTLEETTATTTSEVTTPLSGGGGGVGAAGDDDLEEDTEEAPTPTSEEAPSAVGGAPGGTLGSRKKKKRKSKKNKNV